MLEFPGFTIGAGQSSDKNFPRCLGCGYPLAQLEHPVCPECGRGFDPSNHKTYDVRPPFFRWRYWLPALVMAIVSGFLVALTFLLMGSIGVGLTLGVPFSMGTILGYGVRAGKIAIAVLVGVTVTVVVSGLIAMHPAGMICGLFLAGLFVGPVIGGAVAGAILRAILKNTRFSQRGYLPLLLLSLLLPHAIDGVERRWCGPSQSESIATSMVIPGSPDRAWENLMFYEEVHHELPLLLKLGLPRPKFSVGHITGVGDSKLCIYEHGRLRKRITRYEPGKLLGFDVTEQVHVQDHAIRLLSGSFAFAPVGKDQTRVTLTTVYEPLMTPRWYWRPVEQLCAHTLHEYVLEGMRLRGQTARLASGDTRKTLEEP